jgi:serine/threonine protein kinase
MSPHVRPKAPHSAGKYDLLEKVADGGMASVYRGRDQATGETVAVKLFTARQGPAQEVLLRRFEQEFRVARSLDHPHLVRALDFGVQEGVPYLVMEFVDGPTLSDHVERQGRLAEEEAIRLITQVAGALELVHGRGLVHRDVKPDNVLLTADGLAKLADLGLAKVADRGGNLTRAGTGLGTPNFMAPEQFHDAKHATSRCDIYSLAATLYMAVTGVMPFAGGGIAEVWTQKLHGDLVPPQQLVPGLSERSAWAIRRALSAEPGQRPATCREFVEDLTGRRVLDAGPGLFASESPNELWFLVSTDKGGAVRTAKGSTHAVRRLLKEGLLQSASHVRVGLSESGPFEPLVAHPEFRDLVLPIRPARSAPDTPMAEQTSRPSQLPSREAPSPPPPFRAPAVPALWTWFAIAALAAGAFAFGLSILPH